MRNKHWILNIAILLMAMLSGLSLSPAYGQQGTSRHQPVVYQSTIRIHSGWQQGEGDPNAPAATTADVAIAATVAAIVEHSLCASGGPQCTGQAAAANSNRNPVRIVIQLQADDGNPIIGLQTTAFTVNSVFGPTGGPRLARYTGPEEFQSTSTGVYAIYAQPGSGNWKSGTYSVQVAILAPLLNPNGIRILLPIEIP
jgi:hypothetical protein